MTGLGQVAARGASVTFAAQGTRFLLQIVSLVVLSRLLTPAEVGLVAMVTAILNVAEIIRDFGLSAAAIQAPTLSRAERDNLFWLNLGLGCVCTVAAACLAPALSSLYGEPEVLGIALALAGVFVVSGANTQYRADLSRNLRFKALAASDVGAQALSVIVGVAAAASGAGYWSIVFQQIAFVLSTFLANALMCRWLPGRPRREVSVRRFTRFGMGLLGTNLMGFAVNNVDNVGIGAVWGSGPLGLYGRGYQLLQVPLQQVNAPLSRVVLPVLSRVQDDAATYSRYFGRFQLAACYSLGLGFGLVAGTAGPLVQLLFGPNWSGVAPILTVLAASGVFRGIDSANYQMWVSKGLTSQLFRFYAVSRPLMIVVILAGLPWGPMGVAAGQLVVAVTHWAVGLGYVCGLAGVDRRPLFAQSMRSLALVIAPAAALAHLGTRLVSGAVFELALGIGLGVAWVTLALLAFRPLRRDVMPVLRVLLSRAPRLV